MNNQTITGQEAKLLKPYLKYMDFGDAREDRYFLIEKLMYQNLLLGNIKRTFIEDLRENYIKAHPGAEIPEVLRE